VSLQSQRSIVTPTIHQNLDQFAKRLRRYAELRKMTPADVLTKQGGKLGFALRQRLRGLAPEKGSIRAERLAALAKGEGVRVRASVRREVMEKRKARSRLSDKKVVFGKSKKGVGSVKRKGRRVNLAAIMVQRELSVRESGRAFLSTTARYPRTLKRKNIARSRYGPTLASAGLEQNDETLRFTWDASRSTLAASGVKGINRTKARTMIALAIHDVTADIDVYINRKEREAGRKAGVEVK